MIRGEIEKQPRRAPPIHQAKRIIISAPHASTTKQQIKAGETRRCGCAIHKEFHGLFGLRRIAAYQMPPCSQQRTTSNGVAQKALFLLRVFAHGIAEQRDTARRHTIRDTAQIFLIIGAENAAPRHRKPKPWRKGARGYWCRPKAGTRHRAFFQHAHVK